MFPIPHIKAGKVLLRAECYRSGTFALILSALLLLGACSHYVSACPKLVQYPQEFSDRLADEIEALPDGTALERAINDYRLTREQLRACQ